MKKWIGILIYLALCVVGLVMGVQACTVPVPPASENEKKVEEKLNSEAQEAGSTLAWNPFQRISEFLRQARQGGKS